MAVRCRRCDGCPILGWTGVWAPSGGWRGALRVGRAAPQPGPWLTGGRTGGSLILPFLYRFVRHKGRAILLGRLAQLHRCLGTAVASGSGILDHRLVQGDVDAFAAVADAEQPEIGDADQVGGADIAQLAGKNVEAFVGRLLRLSPQGARINVRCVQLGKCRGSSGIDPEHSLDPGVLRFVCYASCSPMLNLRGSFQEKGS